MRRLLSSAILLLAIGNLGCQSETAPDRLRTAFREICEEAGSTPETTRAFVIIRHRPPVKALAALVDPEIRFLATDRLVTVIVGFDSITLIHKTTTKAYTPKPRLYFKVLTNTGQWEERFYLGERDYLIGHITGIGQPTQEYVAITDSEINTLALQRANEPRYLSCLAEFSKFSEEEYRKWLKSPAGQKAIP